MQNNESKAFSKLVERNKEEENVHKQNSRIAQNSRNQKLEIKYLERETTQHR